MVRNKDILTLNDIKHVQEILEQNTAGFRTTPGTQLKRENDGAVIYTPPQDGMAIVRYMSNLEQFINDDHLSQLDPLIKMAIIHHQFESIHPFYDALDQVAERGIYDRLRYADDLDALFAQYVFINNALFLVAGKT